MFLVANQLRRRSSAEWKMHNTIWLTFSIPNMSATQRLDANDWCRFYRQPYASPLFLTSRGFCRSIHTPQSFDYHFNTSHAISLKTPLKIKIKRCCIKIPSHYISTPKKNSYLLTKVTSTNSNNLMQKKNNKTTLADTCNAMLHEIWDKWNRKLESSQRNTHLTNKTAVTLME
jgi:hypothetical protein